MASTKYEVVRAGKVVETRSEKAAAIKLATQSGDVVRTTAGTVVFEVAGTRAHKPYAKPYTRTDAHALKLGENVKLPAGYSVAYRLPRDKAVILRKGKTNDYLAFSTETGESTGHETLHDATVAIYMKRPAAKRPAHITRPKAKGTGKQRRHLAAA